MSRTARGIVACIGDDREAPTLQSLGLKNRKQVAIDLPGRPRWCVTDGSAERVFLCIREPSMVLVAGLPDLNLIAQWKLPVGGAHGLDIDHARGRLYAACDDGALVEIDSGSGNVTNVWPIPGAPDVTFFNPTSGLVHVAIGEPGLVETLDPRTGNAVRTMTGAGAHTTVLVPPARLYVISPKHGGFSSWRMLEAQGMPPPARPSGCHWRRSAAAGIPLLRYLRVARERCSRLLPCHHSNR